MGISFLTYSRTFLPVQIKLEDAAAATQGTYVNSIATGAAKPTSNATTFGTQTLLLRDGRVLIVPRASSTIDTVSADGLTFTVGPAHGQGTSYAFSCAALLPNGKVLLVPHQAANFVLFDPTSNSATAVAAAGISPTNSSTPAWGGACLGQDDLVYLAPGSGNLFASYNWQTNTLLTIGSSTVSELGSQTTWVVGGMQLLPGGDFLCPPKSTSFNIYRFNPKTGVTTTIAAASLSYICTPILMPGGGEVLLAPANTTNARFLNLATNAITTGNDMVSDATSNRFAASGYMQDGNIWLASRQNTHMVIFNTTTRTFTAAASTGGSSSSANFLHACCLQDGRVLLMPSAAAAFLVWTSFTGGTALPFELLQSRYVNNY